MTKEVVTKTMTTSAENEPTELEQRLAAKAQSESGEADPDMDSAEEEEAETLEAVDMETLLEAHSELEAERDDLKDQLLRARAEFDNYRRRTAREAADLRKTASADLVRDLLPVADNFARALDHADDKDGNFAEGVKMVAQQFADALAKAGVEPIPAVGEPFDPTVHDALAQQPSDTEPAGTITVEYERGYRMGDYVVRPAKVVVSSGPADGGNEEAAPADDAGEEG